MSFGAISGISFKRTTDLQEHAERVLLGEAVQSLGWTLLTNPVEQLKGFPVEVTSPEGEPITMSVPSPPLLDRLDPDRVGLVLVDTSGIVRKIWGLAKAVPVLSDGDLAAEPRLIGLLQAAYRGQNGSVLVDNHRFVAGQLEIGDFDYALILVVDAREEAEARRRAHLSDRKAEALKKIGKALTMHQTLQPMVVSASHAIASAIELAAVLLWVRTHEDGPMELVASVGANRAGTQAVSQIDTEHGVSCAAELAAVRNQPLILANVKDHPVTADLEAKFCYLAPGGLAVWPLTIGSRLVGLLEIVSREDDSGFLESQDLFMTVAEHLSLALNSALMYENVERLAAFDPLTGIANHRTMQEFLQRRIVEAARSQGSLGVIMLDVDHFRTFNEEEGHDAGDKVLKLVADVLRNCVRPYDLAARYGGEEFTVVMPGVNEETTLVIAERIRTGIAQLEYVSSSGVSRHISASLGCAHYPQNASDSASLLKAADLALYEAKRTSRNKTVVYQGEVRQERSSDSKVLLFTMRDFIPDWAREETEAFLKKSRPYINHLSLAMALAPNQVQTVEAAALLLPYWTRLKIRNDLVQMHEIEAVADLKGVVACLADIEERYDGQGPKGTAGTDIPLLTRMLIALKAVACADLRSLSEDQARFDPDILNVLSEMEQAA